MSGQPGTIAKDRVGGNGAEGKTVNSFCIAENNGAIVGPSVDGREKHVLVCPCGREVVGEVAVEVTVIKNASL